MVYEIAPLTRVGPLQLGMSVDEVRAVVPAAPRHLPDGDHRVDAFEALGLSVFYGQQGACEGIALSAPSRPTFDGRPLLGVPFASAEAYLRGRDDSLEVDDRGLVSCALGVALYCPGHRDERTRPVAGVLVFASGL